MTPSEIASVSSDEPAVPADAALVAAACRGDRAAFARVVERHQALVCAIAYGATGDHARAQDLAQETFVVAWKALPSLREPARLRAWLAGIARNLVRHARSRRGAATGSVSLEDVPEPASPARPPLEELLAREEAALLGAALATLPAAYREPLILYYWEDRSIARVAAALEVSVATAKQRLARGRRRLRAEVAALVERGLLRQRPGRAFTLAVAAALPARTAEAVVLGGGASAAASAGTVAASGLAGALGGTLAGLAGAWVGARAAIEGTRSPRERRFIVRMAWAAAACALGFLLVEAMIAFVRPALFRSPTWQAALVGTDVVLVLWLVRYVNRRQREIRIAEGTHVVLPPVSVRERRLLRWVGPLVLVYVVAALIAEAVAASLHPAVADSGYWQLTFAVLYLVGLVDLLLWIDRRHRRIRAEEGGRLTPSPAAVSGRAADGLPAADGSPADGASATAAGASSPPAGRVPAPGGNVPAPVAGAPATPAAVYSSMVGGFSGGVVWMLPFCWMARDWISALLVVGVTLAVTIAGARAALRAPERYFTIASRVSLLLGGLTLAVMNSRWDVWMEAYRRSAVYEPPGELPLWAMDLLVVGVVAWVEVALRRRRS